MPTLMRLLCTYPCMDSEIDALFSFVNASFSITAVSATYREWNPYAQAIVWSFR